MRYDIDPNDSSPEANLCRFVNVTEALPADFRIPYTSDTPLRDMLPGSWPTYGDLVALAEKHFKKTDK